ncbi:Acetyltransferase (GNAT) family [Halalkaliarchaeum sp. AArc-CO]|uniref:GNAT family N-acetyltransferase n=1 Tax=Halalkaliarchaeum sp. AArc-CO TaxID=2866381 RepID=UPI00217DD01A|nr:GNAT family N-acetyltransferase [Halalkaliarchaeum sp. AArc-CO]UWG51824.1 Acetyltransferase (GNAT) family [Halalkaliarchaeum sp. AArc-CO]
MTGSRRYPDEPAGPFQEPPRVFTDREGREIEIRACRGEVAEYDALVEMYTCFDPSDRAQGIPPARDSRIRSWLDTILEEDCHNVVAWHGESAVGHATLVPDDEAYELAIFVLQEYQKAGIGTELIEALLGHGASEGARKVWLTVERWNHAAVELYRKTGFETSNAESFELEMGIRLAEPEE